MLRVAVTKRGSSTSRSTKASKPITKVRNTTSPSRVRPKPKARRSRRKSSSATLCISPSQGQTLRPGRNVTLEQDTERDRKRQQNRAELCNLTQTQGRAGPSDSRHPDKRPNGDQPTDPTRHQKPLQGAQRAQLGRQRHGKACYGRTCEHVRRPVSPFGHPRDSDESGEEQQGPTPAPLGETKNEHQREDARRVPRGPRVVRAVGASSMHEKLEDRNPEASQHRSEEDSLALEPRACHEKRERSQGANACAAEHREQLPKGEERMLPRGL
jgi:hypothetical protein